MAEKKKRKKRPIYSFEMEDELRAELEREAEMEKRTLASYIRWIIDNRQRPKKPS